MPVSSVPLSETHLAGRPRWAMMISSSRTTRRPGSEVSAISVRHSRVKSSTTAMIRKRRPSTKGIRQKVQAPALVRSLRDRKRRPRAERPLASTTPAHLQSLLAVEASELLVVHDQTLAAHQHKHTAIAEPAADRRQLTHAGAHRRIVGPIP